LDDGSNGAGSITLFGDGCVISDHTGAIRNGRWTCLLTALNRFHERFHGAQRQRQRNLAAGKST
jgi:hypothetical protein